MMKTNPNNANVTSYVQSEFSSSGFVIWNYENMYYRDLASLG